MSDLPEYEFLNISAKVPLINVDLLVINEYGEVLLSWRDDDYCGTGWHIPGGIIRHGESILKRLEITAQNELGCIPNIDCNPCKIAEILLDQKYRNHFISLLYKCYCYKDEIIVSKYQEKAGDLRWFNYFPGLVYSQAPYNDYLKEYFLKRV